MISSIEQLVQYHRDNLVELDLDGVELSDASIACVVQCPHLRKLTVSYADILTDEACNYLKVRVCICIIAMQITLNNRVCCVHFTM